MSHADAVLAQLKHGKVHAIKGSVLTQRAKLPNGDERVLREAFRELRERGIPVVQSNKGYYIAETVEEIQKSIDGLKIQAHGFDRRIEMLERIKETMTGNGKPKKKNAEEPTKVAATWDELNVERTVEATLNNAAAGLAVILGCRKSYTPEFTWKVATMLSNFSKRIMKEIKCDGQSDKK